MIKLVLVLYDVADDCVNAQFNAAELFVTDADYARLTDRQLCKLFVRQGFRIDFRSLRIDAQASDEYAIELVTRSGVLIGVVRIEEVTS